jgi:putative phosphoesterase
MILGILSDTHGRHERAQRAVRVLREARAEALIHCGDLGSQRVLDAMAELSGWFVWGNTDDMDPALARYAETLGIRPPRRVPLRIDADGRIIEVYHGHEPEFGRRMNVLYAADERGQPCGEVNYVLHGHTHVANDARIGGARLINPGALHRAPAYSVATLDVARDELRFYDVT